MKKKMTLIATLLSLAIIVLSIYIYKEYITPLYFNNDQQTTSIHLSQNETIELNDENNHQDIFGVEIEILGESNTNLTVFLKKNESQNMKEIKLKKGNIDFIYQNDWYSNTCLLEFSSKEKMTGQLKINYRFLGLN